MLLRLSDKPPTGTAWVADLYHSELDLYWLSGLETDNGARYWEKRLHSLLNGTMGQVFPDSEVAESNIRGRRRQKAYCYLAREIGIRPETLRAALNRYRDCCRKNGIDSLNGLPLGPQRRILEKKVVSCEQCGGAFISYDCQALRRHCSRSCADQHRRLTHKQCYALLRRGWKQKEIQGVLNLSSATISRLAHDIGRTRSVARLAWDDEICAAVQTEINELNILRHGNRERVNEKIAEKYEISVRALEGRLSRYRERARARGENPLRADPNLRPGLSARDKELSILQTRINAMPGGQNRYGALAAELGMPRGTLVNQLKRYRKRCRRKGLAAAALSINRRVYATPPIWDDAKCAEIWAEVKKRWNPRLAPCKQKGVYGPVAEKHGLPRAALIARLRRWRERTANV